MSISSREAAVVVEGPKNLSLISKEENFSFKMYDSPQKTNEKSENVAEPDSLGAKLKPTLHTWNIPWLELCRSKNVTRI